MAKQSVPQDVTALSSYLNPVRMEVKRATGCSSHCRTTASDYTLLCCSPFYPLLPIPWLHSGLQSCSLDPSSSVIRQATNHLPARSCTPLIRAIWCIYMLQQLWFNLSSVPTCLFGHCSLADFAPSPFIFLPFINVDLSAKPSFFSFGLDYSRIFTFSILNNARLH